MITFLLFVIIGLLIYIICGYKKNLKPDRTQISWKKLLKIFRIDNVSSIKEIG